MSTMSSEKPALCMLPAPPRKAGQHCLSGHFCHAHVGAWDPDPAPSPDRGALSAR